MARKKDTKKPALQGGSLTLAEFGRPDLPAFSWGSLPGESVEEKALAYVDALGLDLGSTRAEIVFRVESALAESLPKAERPSWYESDEEILASLSDPAPF